MELLLSIERYVLNGFPSLGEEEQASADRIFGIIYFLLYVIRFFSVKLAEDLK